MQTILTESTTYQRRQTILRSTSVEQQRSESEHNPNAEPGTKLGTYALSYEPPDLYERAERKTERKSEPKSELKEEPDAERNAERSAEQECEQNAELKPEWSAERNAERRSEYRAEQKSEWSAERSSERKTELKSERSAEQSAEQYSNINNEYVSGQTTEPNSEQCGTMQKSDLNAERKSERELEQEARKLAGWKDEYDFMGIKFKAPLIWFNIIMITLLHVFAVWAYIVLPAFGHWKSVFWAVFMGGIAGFGVTAGAHRFWCHRSYKAKLPLQILLAICFSASGQNTIFEWVRDHRVHHKFTETDADPHNSNRGFFFAHVGWLMMKKHPMVLAKGRSMDMTDIVNDPLIQFHNKHFVLLKILFCFLIPTAVPVYFWGEDWWYAFCTQCLIRYACSLNFTWSVNSLAHIYGGRPYDNRINPVENRFVAFIAMGEGWHNYHHVFPWDYKAAELAYTINITTVWIDLFAKLGWAYDRKQPSQELIKSVTVRHGDGTHAEWGHEEIPPPITNSINDFNEKSQ